MKTPVNWENLTDQDYERYGKRLQLVELLLEEKLDPKEGKRIRKQFCCDNHLSDRTLTNWIACYRAAGPAALAFHPQRGPRSLRVTDEELRTKILALVHELPSRSVSKLRRLIGITPALAQKISRLSDRSIYRFLEEQGLGLKARQSMEAQGGSARAYHHFEASCSLALVQGDARDGIWLHLADGSVHKTYLFLWVDDFSRKILFGKYYLDEKLPCLEDSFKYMILRWGVAKAAYLDNGKVYVSRQFASILAELHIKGIHHPPYQAYCKGKIEAVNKTIKNDFQSEAARAGMRTLEELNTAFWAWAEMDYNCRLHSATGQTPDERFREGLLPDLVRIENLREFQAMFLWKERRTVTKWGRLSVYANLYPVTSRPPGTVVEVRFDPFDLSQVWIYDPITRSCLETSSVGKQVTTRAPKVPEEAKTREPEISQASAQYFSRLRARYLQQLKEHQEVPFRTLTPPSPGKGDSPS